MKVGLRQLISAEDALELVASDVPLSDLSDAIEEHSPDVALLNFGSLPSPATVHELHERYPDTRIVVLANRPTAAECNQMLSFGATACISKETQGRDIINAIHLASRGMYVMPRSASSGLVESNGVSRPGPDLLTSRERQVLQLLAEGRSNKEVATLLDLSPHTVETHRGRIMQKLNLHSGAEIILYAIRKGVIT